MVLKNTMLVTVHQLQHNILISGVLEFTGVQKMQGEGVYTHAQ